MLADLLCFVGVARGCDGVFRAENAGGWKRVRDLPDGTGDGDSPAADPPGNVGAGPAGAAEL